MTRRLLKGGPTEKIDEYDGEELQQEEEFDFDGAEIVRPTNQVVVVTPGGIGEAVSTNRAEDEAKAERRKLKAEKDATKKAEEAAAKIKAAKKQKKSTKPKE